MKAVFITFAASLVVILALFVLISEDQPGINGGALRIHEERVSGLGVLETILLQYNEQSESTPSKSMIVKAQRALSDEGFYSGPLDGTMSDRTRDALRSFQRSKQINVTGRMDSQTSRELGLQADG